MGDHRCLGICRVCLEAAVVNSEKICLDCGREIE